MNATKTMISLAVASLVGTAGYSIAQQTGAQQTEPTYRSGTSAGSNNSNVPSATVSGQASGNSTATGTTDSSNLVVEPTSPMDSNARMNSNRRMSKDTAGQSSDRDSGEPLARADRN